MNSLTLPWSWFILFKYVIYTMLALNLLLFLHEEWVASAHVFGESPPAGAIIGAFAQSIDTLAWIALLFLFEFETAVLGPRLQRPGLERTVHVLRLLCITLVLVAFVGYLRKALGMADWLTSPLLDACEAAAGTSMLVAIDEFVALTEANCHMYAAPFLTPAGSDVLASGETHALASRLAWLDVANAGSWILIIALLETDVRLQEQRTETRRWLKLALYSVLFGAAVYWWVDGDWLDFWDASLWLIAFFCIELNVFAWQAMTAPTGSPPAGDPSVKIN